MILIAWAAALSTNWLAETINIFGFGCFPGVLIEKSEKIGGRVQTEMVDGYLLDHGFQVLQTAYPEVQRSLDLKKLDLSYFGSGVAGALSSGCASSTPVPYSQTISGTTYGITLGTGSTSAAGSTGNQVLFSIALGPSDYVTSWSFS